MQVGEWRTWLSQELYKQIDRLVNEKADYKVPYYIQVQLKPEYQGPSMACTDVQDTEVKAHKIYGIRLVCMNRPPAIPMLGTLLFYVDNRSGRCEMVYALPADRPHAIEDSDNEGEISRLVAENAAGLPLVYN